jgi:hypothetical protein
MIKRIATIATLRDDSSAGKLEALDTLYDVVGH